jgi:predicted P-loop ATPase
VPIPQKTKRPTINGWQELNIPVSEASSYFAGAGNIGIILGVDGLTDIDLDCLEAVTAGQYLLPTTGMIFGRASKPRSHYCYLITPAAPIEKLQDPTDRKVTLCEFRCQRKDGGIGLQTVFPPSMHPTGEAIDFANDGEAARIAEPDLRAAFRRTASAALLARHWPDAGSGRHDTMLALAGCLARSGWPLVEAMEFCNAVYRSVTSHDPRAVSRVRAEVSSTYQALADGREVTGFPKLREHLNHPEKVLPAVSKWLGLSALKAVPVMEEVGDKAGQPATELEYTTETSRDEEVDEALAKNDPGMIWAMTAMLATMSEEEYQVNRSAIKARFKENLNIGGLDKAVLTKRKEAKTEERAERFRARDTHDGRCTSNDWCDRLIMTYKTNGDSSPKACLANAITALRFSPEMSGKFWLNEFSLGVERVDGGEWTDHDDRLATEWLQHNEILVPVEIAGQAIQTVARDHVFHPVRDYLNSLRWDGTKRIGSWPSTYLGVPKSDYSFAVGSRWLISAVARIYSPGSKADCCVILEGLQGIKKSTALKILGGEWFSDEIADLGSKDSALQAMGVWIIEIAELDSMSRGDIGSIKAFMSRSTDRFRPPYARHLIKSPRQCVFAGSVNNSTYLRDETGGRRFWPIACTRLMIDELERDRDQIWAEAVVSYRAGASWWLDSPELNLLAEREQSDRYEGDSWDDIIAAWVKNPVQSDKEFMCATVPFSSDSESVTVSDVLNHCIGKRQDVWIQTDKNRVARCLRAIGYKRQRVRDGDSSPWRYRRVEK